jgi:hypothetical protein
MIQAVNRQKGPPRALAACDECQREETITCDYERQPDGSWTLNRGQALSKLTAHGWTEIKRVLRCPSCEAKRKVVTPMKEPKVEERTATREQRRAIVDMLGEVYDTAAERYRANDTDQTVADVLGVMPGWVAQLREEFFGPAGTNETIDSLAAEIHEWREKAKGHMANAEKAIAELKALDAKIGEWQAELIRIRTAVGPHVRAKAGVKG